MKTLHIICSCSSKIRNWKYVLLLLSLFLTNSFKSYSQQSSLGWEDNLSQEQMDALEELLSTQSSNRGSRSQDQYIVPVVVHIMHNNGPENIPDNTVRAAIDYVNQQFQGAFGGYNCNIQFRLATLDPNGNCTTGITRTLTNTPSVIKDYSMSGHTSSYAIRNMIRWPTNRYLNIWIVKDYVINRGNGGYVDLTSSGYVYYRSEAPVDSENDGIIIQYSCLGPNGQITGQGSFVGMNTKGMLAHTLGGSLGLLNVWGSLDQVICCFADESSMDAGDKINDTTPCTFYSNPPSWPNYVTHVLSCSTLWTCNNQLRCTPTQYSNNPNPTSPFPKDNFMTWNFSCQNKFTEGQSDFMKDKIDLFRNQLCTQSNLIATGVINSIPSSITWNSSSFPSGNVYIGQTITVENGAVLTINSGVTARFGTNAKLIIKPGGRVVLNGAKLTSHCGNYWPGVEVWGQTYQQQTAALQGKITISNYGSIEKAECAVLLGARSNTNPATFDATKSGGIIEGITAKFKNNKIDVEFRPYFAWLLQGGLYTPIDNLSYFNACDFGIDMVLPSVTQLDNRVKMNSVNGIKFTACNFYIGGTALTGYSINKRGTAIYAQNAGFTAKSDCSVTVPTGSECDPNQPVAWNVGAAFSNIRPTIFENFYEAVRVIGTYNINPVTIHTCLFKNNQFGVYMSTCTGATIYRNKFLIKEQGSFLAYGVSLLECTGYKVERNVFSGVGALTLLNTGIWISQSAKVANRIYLNDFDNLNVATIAQGEQVNELLDYEGLEMLCGKYTNCKTNIAVQKHGSNRGKIALRQGKHAQHDDDYTAPAGNLFTQTNWGITAPHTDYYICPDGDCDPVMYEHHDASSPWPVIPIYRNPPMVVHSPNEPYFYTRQVACPVGTILQARSLLLNTVELSRLEIAEKNSELEQLVDGGNTTDVTNLIQNTANSSATVRASLLPLAPYLSDKVQRELIMRNPALNVWHLCELLIACSPLKHEIMTLVDEENLLPEYLYNLILSYQDGKNGMIYKQMALKAAKMDKAMALDDFYRLSMEEGDIAELKILLQDEDDKYALRNKIALEDYLSNSVEAQNLLATYEENTENEVWKQCREIAVSIEAAGGYSEESAADYVGNLEALASSGKEGCHYAAAMIEIITGTRPEEELNLPVYGLKRAKQKKDRPGSERPLLSQVYPNPAVGEFYITYVLPAERKSAHIRIFDLQGKLILTEDITHGFGILDLNANSFASGIYVYDLLLNGEKVDNGKFNVQR